MKVAQNALLILFSSFGCVTTCGDTAIPRYPRLGNVLLEGSLRWCRTAFKESQEAFVGHNGPVVGQHRLLQVLKDLP